MRHHAPLHKQLQPVRLKLCTLSYTHSPSLLRIAAVAEKLRLVVDQTVPPHPYSSHCSHSVSPPPAAAVAEQLRLVIALFEGLEKLSGNDYPAYLQVGVGSVGKVWTCHRRPPPAGPFRSDVQSPPPSMHTPLLHSRLCLHCVRVRSQPPQHVSPLQTMMKPLCDVLRRTPLHSTLCSHLPPPPPFTADHDEAAV